VYYIDTEGYMFADTHAHLNFKAFDKDLDAVIARANGAAVKNIIIPGAKIDSSQKAIDIAKKFSGCFAAIGIHPHHSGEISHERLSTVLETLSSLTVNQKVVAIGEIGLDKHHYKNYPPVSEDGFSQQKALLLAQLDIAQTHKLPVILHCRDAQDEMLELLSSYKKTHPNIRGVFHCFESTLTHLKKVLDLGFYVGFDGNVTYKENTKLHKLVKATPLSQLLLETDSPYLTPVPFRGTRNEPAYITNTASFIAHLINKSSANVALETSINASSLFHLPEPL